MLLDFIKTLRLPNLVIVAVCQTILLFGLIRQVATSNTLRLTVYDTVLFIGVTVLITLSGYIINDRFDKDSDLINHKGNHLTETQLLYYYIFILVVGLIISIYLGLKIGQPYLIIIYPIAILLLFVYSKYLKSRPLIGNVIVALFTAFVAWITLVAEPSVWRYDPINSTLSQPALLIVAFGIFSFFINLVREITKDIEDLDGDSLSGMATLPISIGVEKTKIIIYFHTFILMVLVVLWTSYIYTWHTRIVIYNILFILGPTAMSIFQLSKSRTSADYKKVSTLDKWIMLSGLISLILTINYVI